MIIFDYKKYLKDVKKDGIKATDPYANSKIDMLLTDLVFNSTYSKTSIIKKVRKVADDYYNGLPDDLVIQELTDSYKRIKDKGESTHEENKVLTLYKSEMETIAQLKDEKLQRLLFASLVAFKWHSQHGVFGKTGYYKMIAECMSDIYQLAHFESVSGTTKNKLQHKLSELGLVQYRMKTNSAYRYQPIEDGNRKRWIAFTQFSVPFCVEVKGTQDEEEIFMQMRNYDDVLLYWRLYNNDPKVTTCAICGSPIETTTNSKLYCSTCADEMKKQQDNARYKAKKAI